MNLLERIAKNTEEMGSFTISYNDHKSVYETVEKHLSNHPDLYDFESEEMKNKCIETNTLWELHWYKRTPVSFYKLGAPTYQDLVRLMVKEFSEVTSVKYEEVPQ